VRFHLAPLDLTLSFRQNRPNEPSLEKVQVTINWPQAKIMLYFLQANIAIYETLEGKAISLPKEQLPPPPKMDEAADPLTAAVNEKLHKLHEAFLATLG
jgi:hypothetical protein